MLADIISQFYDIDRPNYRKKGVLSRTTSRASSFSRPSSFRNPPSRTVSINNPLREFKPLEVPCIYLVWPFRDVSLWNGILHFYLRV